MGMFDSLGNMLFGGPYGGQSDELMQQLRAQAMGQGPSMVGIQSQDMLNRGMAQQRSMAAGARPGQQGMLKRLAMQNMGNLTGQINQQATLGRLAERNQAQQNYMGLLGQLRQQPTGFDQMLGAVGPGVSAYLMSDERLKEDIEDGREKTRGTLDGIRALAYRYKDAKHGEGDQIGILAQDLERTPIGKQTVVETPEGKAIHPGRAVGFSLAALADLHDRVKTLEGAR